MNTPKLCKALANAERGQLLVCLAKAQTVTELLGRCHLSQSALSQHLKVLRDTGVVTTEKEGKFVRYKARDAQVVKIAKLILMYK
jgi:ArsR family transcriptional regulator